MTAYTAAGEGIPWPDEEPLGSPYDEPRVAAVVNGHQHGGPSTEAPPRTWLPADLRDVLDGTWLPAEPTVGLRSDGVGLFYRGKQHTVASESEGGKTYFLLTAAHQEISRGNHVAYYDFEDDRGPVIGRLLTMGANPDRLLKYFHYIRPEAPLNKGPVNRADLDAIMAEYSPTLAVIDGVTEAMVLHGLDPLDNRDAATFGRMLPRRLAQWGAAAVSLDHLTKSSDTRGRYSLGAVHKLNALDGAAYVLENRHPFGVGIRGVSYIRIAKDRPGQLRKRAVPNAAALHWFADLVLDGTLAEGHTEATIVAPNADTTPKMPTRVMQRVSDELAKHPGGLPQRVLCDVVQGGSATIRLALSYLIAGGYVDKSSPHKLIRPYSEGDDVE